MTAALLALFVSSAASAPAAPAAPAHPLAGKAKQVEAVMVVDDTVKPLDLVRHAVHSTGERKPAFNPKFDPRRIV